MDLLFWLRLRFLEAPQVETTTFTAHPGLPSSLWEFSPTSVLQVEGNDRNKKREKSVYNGVIDTFGHTILHLNKYLNDYLQCI